MKNQFFPAKTFLASVFLLLSGVVSTIGAQDNETLVRNLVRGKGGDYRDDQLYVALSYNIFTARPDGMQTYSFSNTLSLGYIRDLPVNRRRNIGFGIGVGFSFHSNYTNLIMTKEVSGEPRITIVDKDQYRSNRFSLQTIDIPFQIRFRGSTAEKYKFWRAYALVTASWVFKNYTTLHDGNRKVRYYNLPYLRSWLWTANLQVGYDRITLKADYTLNSVFKPSEVGEIPGLDGTRTLSIGLLVYLL